MWGSSCCHLNDGCHYGDWYSDVYRCDDQQSVQLAEKLAANSLTEVIKEVTGLNDDALVAEIEEQVKAK